MIVLIPTEYVDYIEKEFFKQKNDNMEVDITKRLKRGVCGAWLFLVNAAVYNLFTPRTSTRYFMLYSFVFILIVVCYLYWKTKSSNKGKVGKAVVVNIVLLVLGGLVTLVFYLST